MYNDFSIILTLNYYRKDAKRFMEVLTENETYYVDLLNNKITDSDNNILFHDSETSIIDTYKSIVIQSDGVSKWNVLSVSSSSGISGLANTIISLSTINSFFDESIFLIH